MPTWSPTPAAFALPSDRATGPDPGLERFLRRWFALGLLAVALVPALRGSSEWLGWWPLWLVFMPLAAWWALHRFRMPPVAAVGRIARRLRPRRQARRRHMTSGHAVAARAALRARVA